MLTVNFSMSRKRLTTVHFRLLAHLQTQVIRFAATCFPDFCQGCSQISGRYATVEYSILSSRITESEKPTACKVFILHAVSENPYSSDGQTP